VTTADERAPVVAPTPVWVADGHEHPLIDRRHAKTRPPVPVDALADGAATGGPASDPATTDGGTSDGAGSNGTPSPDAGPAGTVDQHPQSDGDATTEPAQTDRRTNQDPHSNDAAARQADGQADRHPHLNGGAAPESGRTDGQTSQRSHSNGQVGDQPRGPVADGGPDSDRRPGGPDDVPDTPGPGDPAAGDGTGTASFPHRVAAATRGHAVDAGRVAGRAMSNAWRDRVLGLAAEAGFWQLLSLPPLLLALLGSIGYIGDALGSDAVNSIRNSLLRGADDLLTTNVVDDVVRPTVDQILTHGRPDVISIGFILSLWTGSTAMATFVNTITIAYGQRDLRSAVRSRLVALRLFIAQVLTGVIILPALVLGPGLLADLLHAKQHPVVKVLLEQVFWPTVAVLALAMLTSLYHLALPQRRPWRRALPGALFALVGWLVGSYLLRFYLERVFGNELVYGSLAAPAAALLFFYITALAVLLGAELNAALDQRRAASQGTSAGGTQTRVAAASPSDEPPAAGPATNA